MPGKLTAAQAKQFWTEETHKVLCDAIEASLAETTTYKRGVNKRVYADTVDRLQRLGKVVTCDDVKKHYETYRRRVTGGERTLWSVAFAELLPVSPHRTHWPAGGAFIAPRDAPAIFMVRIPSTAIASREKRCRSSTHATPPLR